jgi:hypothetical protein
MELTLDLVNEETGATLRVTIIGRGQIYRGSKRHTKHCAILEFSDSSSSSLADRPVTPVAFYPVTDFLSGNLFKHIATSGKSYPKITQKNCEQIDTWLNRLRWTMRGVNASVLEKEDPELFWASWNLPRAGWGGRDRTSE